MNPAVTFVLVVCLLAGCGSIALSLFSGRPAEPKPAPYIGRHRIVPQLRVTIIARDDASPVLRRVAALAASAGTSRLFGRPLQDTEENQ